ncbi:MAG: hypothetical protein QXO40_01385 [Candidatus Aenigmatarchaeota archaeon]
MESWKLHTVLHFIIPTILFILSFLYIQELSLIERIVAIFIGAFLPDIDHFIYLKYIKFTSLKEFLIFNIRSDRERRGFLIFHNIYFITILLILVPIIMFLNLFLSLLFLAFLIHLIFDFFEDRILLHTSIHWRKIRK